MIAGFTRGCGESIEEVRFHWDLGGAVVVYAVGFNASIQIVASASLANVQRNLS